MSLNFTQLAAFAAVAESGSVIAGAEKLLVSQPAVSRHLKQLERSLGHRLFARHPKGVRLTEAGELLQDYARRIFALSDDAESAIADLDALRRGRLRIGATPTLAAHFLPDLLVRFRRRFPAIRMELRTGHTSDLELLLLDGRLDLALTESPGAAPGIASSIFLHDDLIAIAPSRHPLRRKRSVTLQNFAREPFIAREVDTAIPSFVQRALEKHGLSLTPTLTLASTEAIKHAVAAGLGVAIVSRLAARLELQAKRLVELPVKSLPLRRPLYHLWNASREPSKPARALFCLINHDINQNARNGNRRLSR